jgi:hypothetical protein
MVATVLPYIDFLATESYVSELIKQTKILDEYRVQVFPMRQRYQLLQALKCL